MEAGDNTFSGCFALEEKLRIFHTGIVVCQVQDLVMTGGGCHQGGYLPVLFGVALGIDEGGSVILNNE